MEYYFKYLFLKIQQMSVLLLHHLDVLLLFESYQFAHEIVGVGGGRLLTLQH